MKMYDYLVAYNFSNKEYLTPSHGDSQISRKKTIKSFKDINEINKFLTDSIEGASNLAIYNFILLGRNKH